MVQLAFLEENNPNFPIGKKIPLGTTKCKKKKSKKIPPVSADVPADPQHLRHGQGLRADGDRLRVLRGGEVGAVVAVERRGACGVGRLHGGQASRDEGAAPAGLGPAGQGRAHGAAAEGQRGQVPPPGKGARQIGGGWAKVGREMEIFF